MKKVVWVDVLMNQMSRVDEVTLRMFCRAKNFRWVLAPKSVALGRDGGFGRVVGGTAAAKFRRGGTGGALGPLIGRTCSAKLAVITLSSSGREKGKAVT